MLAKAPFLFLRKPYTFLQLNVAKVWLVSPKSLIYVILWSFLFAQGKVFWKQIRPCQDWMAFCKRISFTCNIFNILLWTQKLLKWNRSLDICEYRWLNNPKGDQWILKSLKVIVNLYYFDLYAWHLDQPPIYRAPFPLRETALFFLAYFKSFDTLTWAFRFCIYLGTFCKNTKGNSKSVLLRFIRLISRSATNL